MDHCREKGLGEVMGNALEAATAKKKRKKASKKEVEPEPEPEPGPEPEIVEPRVPSPPPSPEKPMNRGGLFHPDGDTETGFYFPNVPELCHQTECEGVGNS